MKGKDKIMVKIKIKNGLFLDKENVEVLANEIMGGLTEDQFDRLYAGMLIDDEIPKLILNGDTYLEEEDTATVISSLKKEIDEAVEIHFVLEELKEALGQL